MYSTLQYCTVVACRFARQPSRRGSALSARAKSGKGSHGVVKAVCYVIIQYVYCTRVGQCSIAFFFVLTKLRYSGPLGSCTLPRAISNALLWYPSRPHAHHSNSTVQYPSYRTSSHVSSKFHHPFWALRLAPQAQMHTVL